ncbi:MAG: hypothetical protein US98_C0032G0005 [Parcubacteria group bacterium GW2011_GWC1_38_6]|nr:MAG: hypothetical protein US98_C0032G0005 [Parcubacteria group bacterium GW2011_GWC1_38_6]
MSAIVILFLGALAALLSCFLFREAQMIGFIPRKWWDTNKTSHILLFMTFQTSAIIALGSITILGAISGNGIVGLVLLGEFFATIVGLVLINRVAHRQTMLECAHMMAMWIAVDYGFGNPIEPKRRNMFVSWLRAGGVQKNAAEALAIRACGY